jgi:DNA-directed RNA polymerase subunit F
LAGFIELDNEENENKPANAPEGEASFSKKPSDTIPLSEDQERYFSYLKHLEDSFDEKEVKEVMEIIETLVQKPENIKLIAELLNINPEQKTN